jgi:hypothetical protein
MHFLHTADFFGRTEYFPDYFYSILLDVIHLKKVGVIPVENKFEFMLGK